MATVRVTVAARRDLMDIWIKISQDNVAAANNILNRIQARIESLARHPELGGSRPSIAPEARVLIERPYLILYRAGPGTVEIVRVLHGARQVNEALFREGTG